MSEAPRILIIDDNPLEMILIGEAFAALAWTADIEQCTSEGAAIDSLRRSASDGQRPHLVLLDFRLNGSTSSSCLAAIRSLDGPGWAQPVVVMSSATLLPADRDECLSRGVLTVLRKPDEFSGLVRLVEGLKQFLVGDGRITEGGSVASLHPACQRTSPA